MVLSLESINVSDEGMTMDDFYILYLSILGTNDPMNDAIQSGLSASSSPITSFNLITGTFLKHIKDCDDADIACQLVESWSVFALNYEKNALSSMADLTWSAVKAKYSISGATRCFHAPYIFTHTLNRLLPGSLASKTRKNALEQSVHETVVKLVVSKSRNSDKTSFWVNGILRHWGILVLSMENGDSTIYNHLAQLFSNLAQFLKRAHRPISARLIEHKCDDTSDDDGEYIPPADRREVKSALPTFKVGGVDAGTFPVIFDILLQISVATLSILSIDRETLNSDSFRFFSPYRRFASFINFFGSMVTLYHANFSIFPPKTLNAVLRASNSMVSASSFQLQRCIEWRNAQPILPAQSTGAGDNDPASAKFLKEFLDAIETHVVGTLQSICGLFDQLSDSTGDRPIKGTVPSFAVGYKPGIKSLGIRTEKLKTELLRAASVHSLAAPDSNQGTRSAPSEDNEHVVQNPFGALEFLQPSSTEAQGERQVVGVHRRESLSPRRVLDTEQCHSSSSDEGSMSLSSSSDSFGAMGDWGASSESEDIEANIQG
jgi:hypothetical protein